MAVLTIENKEGPKHRWYYLGEELRRDARVFIETLPQPRRRHHGRGPGERSTISNHSATVKTGDRLNLAINSADLSRGVNVKQSHAEMSPRISNCFFFAVSRWLKYGGYVIIRKSHYGWWPHFLWSRDLRSFEEYSPAIPNQHLLIPPPLYRGVIKVNDAGDLGLSDMVRLSLALSQGMEQKQDVVAWNGSGRDNTGAP